MKVIKKDELEARFSMYNYKATTDYIVLNKPLVHYNIYLSLLFDQIYHLQKI